MVKGLSETERSALLDFTARLRERFPREVESIRLYGSKARGVANKDSDIDVLILVKKRTDEIDEDTIDTVCNILNQYGVYIETVTMTGSEYKSALERQYPFALNVERDAVSL